MIEYSACLDFLKQPASMAGINLLRRLSVMYYVEWNIIFFI